MGLSPRKIRDVGDGPDYSHGKKEPGTNPGESPEGSFRAGRLGNELKKRYRLHRFHSVSEHLRDNDFILRHYRGSGPLKQTLLSVFSLHNETLNIWTHLLGFFLFLGLTIYTAVELPRVAESSLHQFPGLQSGRWEAIKDDIADMVAPRPQNAITRWPFFIFLGGAMFCLLTSSTCHLLIAHSERLAHIMLRLDYSGIACLIAASFYPPVYYSFLCNPTLCKLYLISITAMGLATILFSLLPMFRTHQYRPVRAILFFSMGVSGIIPCVHKLVIHWDNPIALKTFALEIVMGSLYGLGALIYATRVPERWNPGKFDITGHSHQLFHVLVVAGAFTHYRAGLLYLKWRDIQGCSD